MTAPVARLVGDRYVLETLIAMGGMGEVWQARDTVLERQVAVKVPRAGLAHDPDFLERFRSEARHAALLAHPNIASVFDFGSGEDSPFLVMELVTGEPLSRVIGRDAPLDPAWVEGVVRHVASALECAHRAGVVHRDIKPANLLVGPDGAVKVTDFGIARAVGDAGTTQVGLVTGTAPYLSPERLRGEPATPASDVYALGVVAYECLAGRRPFDGDPTAIWWAHQDERPAPPLPERVPPSLRSTVAAMLARDPVARPSSGELAAPEAPSGATIRTVGPAPAPTQVLPTPPAAAPVRPVRPVRPVPPPAVGLPRPAAPRAARAATTPAATRALLRDRPVLAVLCAAVVLLVLGLLALPHRGAAPHGSVPPAAATGPAPSHALHVAGVTLFHPGGSGEDHPGDVGLAADGSAATAWRTQHYASQDFGGLRPGVGLVFDLGQPSQVRQLRVVLADPGASLQVRVGDQPDRLLGSALVARSAAAPAVWTVRTPSGVAGRYWLVWCDHLPPGGQAGIAEVTFTA